MPTRMSVSSSAPLRDVLPLRRGLAAALPAIAADLARGIRRRTEAGRDVSGRPLRPKRDGSASTLHDSGRMVASLRPTQIGERSFTLAPTGRRNQRVAALAHQTGRRWVGADETQIDAATERVTESMIPEDR